MYFSLESIQERTLTNFVFQVDGMGTAAPYKNIQTD